MVINPQREGFCHLHFPLRTKAPGDFPAGGFVFRAPPRRVSEAIQLCAEELDCFVALLLAMTGADYFERTTSPYFGASLRKPRSIIQSTFS
jgi:hypothetical protein